MTTDSSPSKGTDDSCPTISVLLAIPTFNNRDTLRDVVEDALSTGLPVLVVNDGSTDGGCETLDDLPVHRVDSTDNARPERSEGRGINRGKGAAIVAAGRWAETHGFTHVITLDADGQHDPREVGRFLERIQRSPQAIIIGKRDFPAAQAPRSSRFGRRFSNFWLKVACGISLPDSQSGFRAYPVPILRQVKCASHRFDFEIEILVRSVWAGATLDTVDISVRYDEQTRRSSRFRPWLDNARISLTYTRLVLRNFAPWPHKTLIEDPRTGEGRLSLKRLRHSWEILLRESTTPREMSAAAMLGIFLGTLPLIACHSVIIIFCATRLRLNRLIALNVSHICAPPFVPALAIEVGFFVRNGRWLTDFSVQTLGREIHQRLLDYLIGSMIVGPILALAAGGLVFLLAWLYQSHVRHRRRTLHGRPGAPPMADRTSGDHSPQYGGRLGHAIFHWWIRRLGVAPSYVLAALIIPYYVAFRPNARRAASPYLKRRFPDLSPLRRFAKTIEHFYTFGKVLIDQAAMGILGPQRFKIEFPRAEELHQLAQAQRGLVMLTTHAGYWQTSMANVGDLEVPVHFQLRLEPHTAGRHFFELAGENSRFRIISPEAFLGGMVEMTSALRSGECVAVMGDRAFGGKTQTAEFLGERAAFPIAPFHLAVHTGAEVVVLLTARTGKCAYRIEHTRITRESDRGKIPREEMINELLQRYVACLEEYVFRHPLMWYNFFDFWSRQEEGTP